MKPYLFFLATSLFFLISCNSSSNSSQDSYNSSGGEQKSPQQLKAELLQLEQDSPEDYLTADGDYKENFWGDKFKIKCYIHNSATLASYKDIVIRVTFYSQTDTEIGSENYTIYEVIDANSDIAVDLKIDAYSDVSSIGWDVISATPIE